METPRKKDAEQLHYAPPHWSCTGYYGMGWYWISLSHSSSTHCRYFKQPTLHLRGIGANFLPYLHCLATTIFQQDNARPHVARIVQRLFVNHQIELLPWPACSPDLSPIENMWHMVAQRLTQITPPAATPDQLWQRVESTWSAVSQEHIQSLFESMPRRVAAVISNNGGYSGY
ncbi:transposable element Tcb1 transposase [Trichonephila clavipes]|nr:transposable element Tcb1 transposase [Trichonephila clavipes]